MNKFVVCGESKILQRGRTMASVKREPVGLSKYSK